MNTPASSRESEIKRLQTGVPGLDTILNGGLMEGGIYIIQGDPGAGKTILTNQICFHHISNVEGSRALFVTLLAENHARMMSNLRGLSFFDESRIPDGLTYLSAFNELREDGTHGVTSLLRREYFGVDARYWCWTGSYQLRLRRSLIKHSRSSYTACRK